jgi:metallo-beta-lactamase family protein
MSSKIEYSCHGAAREVTGSCHRIQFGGHQILVDCGLFQGRRDEEEANAEAFGFDPCRIDALLLTHAHLDHCGRIPRLVKQGFKGPIYATAATRELVRVVLMDAARLQEEDAARASRLRHRRGEAESKPLFTLEDVVRTLDQFAEAVPYNQPIQIVAGIHAEFIDAGHILGSACILLVLEDGDMTRRIVFSGDIGYSGRAILRDPTPAPAADYVVMETTYGDRNHRSLEKSVDEFYAAVSQTLARGGNVVIPTFALERAQEILYYLHRGTQDSRLPKDTSIFLDSPMAISATEIFRRHPEGLRETFAKELDHDDLFATPNLHFSRDTSESMAINRIEGGAIIIAGSGMCTGGRVRHHLKHNLWREKSSVIFVGYAAQGTLGRRIVDGAKRVRIFNEIIQVNADIHTINGFSAHADQDGLLNWLGELPRRSVFLVHGEQNRGMQAMAERLANRGLHVQLPERDRLISLD